MYAYSNMSQEVGIATIKNNLTIEKIIFKLLTGILNLI